MHHRWGIDYRVCVWRYTDAGDTAGDSSTKLALHSRFMFLARFTQARLQIDQSGTNDLASRIDCLIGCEIAPGKL